MYVYIKSEADLWTVGFYRPDGKWESESDHNYKEQAAKRVALLNGKMPENHFIFFLLIIHEGIIQLADTFDNTLNLRKSLQYEITENTTFRNAQKGEYIFDYLQAFREYEDAVDDVVCSENREAEYKKFKERYPDYETYDLVDFVIHLYKINIMTAEIEEV